MFADKARIFVQGGRGGDGCLSFRREAMVPKGGPDGGDGGRGATVELVCDDSLRDLASFGRRVHFKAPRGRHGEGALRRGRDGADLVVPVPPGTHVTTDAGAVYDLVLPGQRAAVARGGSGGRGNARFTSPVRQAPRFAERGLDGDEGWIDLRLKLLADVGLVGLPNAGKSSLVGRLTRAHPKVADYPFTTLTPVLGTLEGDGRQLVVADIPGLIEGASEGRGLGHEFLAHVERCRLLVHVLEPAPLDGSDPVANHARVEAELAAHDARLGALPRILALSKADLVTAEEAERTAAAWRIRLGDEVPVHVTSSATRAGLDALGAELLRTVPLREVEAEVPAIDDDAPLAEHRVYRPGAQRGWQVQAGADADADAGGATRAGTRAFRVVGPGVERLLARHDPDNEEAMEYVESRLRRMGVIDGLRDAGFEAGDEVEIAGIVFELDPAL